MKLRVIFDVIRLNLKLPKNNMELYTIWWQPQLQSAFVGQCPFVNVGLGTYVGPTAEWANGYYWLEQQLNNNQFGQVDASANQHVCIDIRPGTRPPGSPHGR